jgi:alkylation response protein AidB-like acyl-CoA dehydrogenase
MLEGRFTGTMNLSETQAGSSLGDITCKAFARPDGLYDIVGNKMWISGGEHDLSENIVHMVLAKVADPGAGVLLPGQDLTCVCQPTPSARRRESRASRCSSCPSGA